MGIIVARSSRGTCLKTTTIQQSGGSENSGLPAHALHSTVVSLVGPNISVRVGVFTSWVET